MPRYLIFGTIAVMQFQGTNRSLIVTIVLGVLLVAVIGLGLTVVSLKRAIGTQSETIRKNAAAMQEEISLRDARVLELESVLTETKTLLENSLEKNADLKDDLEEEKDRNDEFEDQIEKIGSTVGTLDKLAKTDKELLMKYSKVYFLNEHYMPEKLKELPSKSVRNGNGDPEFIQRDVYPHLVDLLEDAEDDKVPLLIVSAFRSFDEQKSLKGAYSVTYGSGANTFSADQGYSEHQLGTTVDFTTSELGGGLTGFENTPAYTWLRENAHKYGFVLSYPPNNAYYTFEPWHWRFVGIELARDLHNDGKYFYDADQREIDKYLVSIFD